MDKNDERRIVSIVVSAVANEADKLVKSGDLKTAQDVVNYLYRVVSTALTAEI